MNIHEALRAISMNGEGYCWYCDQRLPEADEAISAGWQVQRVEGEMSSSLILICPTCKVQREELGEEGFLRQLSLRVCNSTC